MAWGAGTRLHRGHPRALGQGVCLRRAGHGMGCMCAIQRTCKSIRAVHGVHVVATQTGGESIRAGSVPVHTRDSDAAPCAPQMYTTASPRRDGGKGRMGSCPSALGLGVFQHHLHRDNE